MDHVKSISNISISRKTKSTDKIHPVSALVIMFSLSILLR